MVQNLESPRLSGRVDSTAMGSWQGQKTVSEALVKEAEGSKGIC